MLRKPAVAGTFYPDNPEILKKTIEDCFINKFGVGFIPELETFDGIDYPINVMVPHAGFKYSGSVASHSYCQIV
ncbi:MAG: AmmeMemoRadiSam system protein B, partial [Methanobrevibacter sp.]|nr:AmmeMemoRadiSam system protein B [Methanobrevibacter sp.]